MVRVRVVLTDKLNQPIPGVGGPLSGVTGLSYTPEGCVLDGIGYVRFKIPLTTRRNIAVVPGTRVQVFEDNTTRAAWGVVTAKSETISEDGIFAQFDCPDLFFLLQKLTVTSGYASAPGETLAITLARLVGLDTREAWAVFSDLFDPVTGATPYDGIPFSQQGGNIASATTKLAGERFSHVKRGIGFSLEFGPMNTPATFVAPGPDPWTTLAAPVPNEIWNTITLTGAGFFPTTGNYDVIVGTERMTVWAGQGTTTLAVIRGNPPVPHNAGEKVTAIGQGTTMARLVGRTGNAYAANSAVRFIDLTTLKHERNGEVVNDIVPVNGDGGTSQLTLRTLYNPVGETARLGPNGVPDGSYQSGPVGFTGNNPAYPICRRPSASGATFDGMDYFLQDTASIAANDLYMENPQPVNIAPVQNAAGGISPADLQLAAVALYQWGVSYLLRGAQPQETVSCTTLGYADVRDFAGKTVHVFVEKQRPDGTPHIDVDLTPMVLKVEVAWDDATGDPKYTWDLSTNGKQAASISNLVLGGLSQLQQNAYRTPTFPVPIYMPTGKQNIGANADLVLDFPARNNVTAVHSMIAFLSLEGLVHSRLDNGHTQDVITAPIPHDVNALAHDVKALPTDLNIPSLDANIPPLPITSSASLTVQDVAGSGGTGSTSVTAKLISGSVELFTTAANAGSAPLAGMPTTTAGRFALSAVVGKLAPGAGTVQATSGGSGGTVQATTGGAAGTTLKATHAITDGFGAQLAFATVEEVYRGPAPTGVTLWVDNVQRFGPFNATPAPLDLSPFVVDGSAHEFRVKSPTNGAASLLIMGVEDWTTLAAGR